jgi:LacI family transcriptional regulator, galactose operon repressor
MKKTKEVTIYDLAHKLNSSFATVSRVLKNDAVVSKKTRKKIYDLTEEMGYRHNHFARNLREQRQLTDEIKTNNFSTDIGCPTAH